MSETPRSTELSPLVVHLRPHIELSDEQFYELCQSNPDLRLERAAGGEVLIMAPTGGDTGRRSFRVAGALAAWIDDTGSGIGFDSSTGFVLSTGAIRSPDLAWVETSRWEGLSDRQQERFVPLCPDFVVELRSPSDKLTDLQDKMEEYRTAGARLGWLIDPIERRVFVYRPQEDVVCLEGATSVSAEPVLPGFVLELAALW